MSTGNADNEIVAEFLPLYRQYKSGRIEFLNEGDKDQIVPAEVGAGVHFKDVTIDPDTDVKARIYHPKSPDPTNKKLPVLVFFHGGGFFFESFSSKNYHTFVDSISHQARLLTVSVDYRLAPAHVLPAAYEDSVTALKWVLSGADDWIAEYGDLDHVFIAGDSAGANIAHNLAMTEGVKVEKMALICPYFWGKDPIPNETTDPILRGLVDEAWRIAGLDPKSDDPRMNPQAEGGPSLKGLGSKRALVCTADEDPLVWRAKAYYDGLKHSGWEGKGQFIQYMGVGHDFFIGKLDTYEAKLLLANLAAFFSI